MILNSTFKKRRKKAIFSAEKHSKEVSKQRNKEISPQMTPIFHCK